jgi:hypothetical protein
LHTTVCGWNYDAFVFAKCEIFDAFRVCRF